MAQPLMNSESLPVRALIADDYVLFRMGLSRALVACGIMIVGEAGNGREAVRMAAELKPDVVVMDTDMPVMGGLEATREIMKLPNAPAVLMLADAEGNASGDARSTSVLDALLAGARSFLLKDGDVADLAEGIRRAAAGESALSPSVAGALVERLRELESERRHESRRAPSALTGREQQVLTLVVEGRDNAAIGQELSISASTAKHHVAAILEKLGAANRTQAAAEAVRFGLV